MHVLASPLGLAQRGYHSLPILKEFCLFFIQPNKQQWHVTIATDPPHRKGSVILSKKKTYNISKIIRLQNCHCKVNANILSLWHCANTNEHFPYKTSYHAYLFYCDQLAGYHFIKCFDYFFILKPYRHIKGALRISP